MSTKRLAEVQAQMDLLRQKLAELEELPEPDGDEALRAQVVEERDKQADNYIAEYKGLEVELGPLIDRAKELDVIRAAARDQTRLEPGDGAARYMGGQAPGFNKKVDPFGDDPRRISRQDAISRAMTVIDDEKRVFVSDASKTQLERFLHRSGSPEDEGDYQLDGSYIARRTLLTENDAYRAAFQKYCRLGNSAQFNREEQDAVAAYQDFEIKRAVSENTTTAGGFGIPVLIDPSIIITSGAADVPLLRYCRVETVTNNLWQGVSSAGMTWSYSTEGTEASDNSPTLAQPTVRVHMAKGWLPYSIEVSMDYPDFTTEFGRLIDSGYNDLLATKTMQGTGSSEPFGAFVALSNATSVITPTTDGSFGGVDVFKIWNSVPERYRTNAVWVMSVNVQSAIRQFAASQSATSAYFTIDLTGGVFRINDRPVIITDYAPTGVGGSVPGTTGLQNILAVADWQQTYLWVNRAGMSVEQVPMLFGASNRFPTGQRGLFAWARNGGNTVNNSGGRLLQNQ